MALTPLRWFAALIAGALLVLAYAYTPRERVVYQPDTRELLAARERRMAWMVTQTTDRLRASIVIDSLGRSVRPSGADTLRVFIASGIPSAAHATLVMATRRALQVLGSHSLPIDVAFVLDTAQEVRGHARGARFAATGEHVLPVGANDRCLSVIRLRWPLEPGNAVSRSIQLAESLNEYRLLGPCAFIGAFGRPGPRITQWLNDGAWGYALLAGWSRRAPTWQPPEWVSDADAGSRMLRNYMGLDGYRCAAGDLDACQTAAVTPAPVTRASALPRVWGGRVVSSSQSDNEWWYRLNLGPRQSNFLSDLVVMMGHDDFRRFWTSSDPVPAALASATGRSIGSMTREWAQSQYAGYARRGTRVPPLTAGLALLFVGAGTASAVVAARRRRVR
jgi:hypothetical protein